MTGQFDDAASVSNFGEALERYGRVLFTGKGRSMLPLIRANRDAAVIDKRPTDKNGRPLRCKKHDAVLYRQAGWYVLHRVLKVLPQGYVICGDNCWRREYDVREEQIIGVMTALLRGGREIPVTNKWYRFYVRLWCGLYPVRTVILWAVHALYRIWQMLTKPFASKKK